MVTANRHSRRFSGHFAAALFSLATLGGCDRIGRSTDFAHLEQARSFAAKGNHQAAIIEAKNALQLNPQNVDARLLLGNLYLAAGHGQEAEIALKQALVAGGDEQAIVLPLARALLLQRDFNRVLAEVKPASGAVAAIDAQLFSIRGEAQLERGRGADAAGSFQRALALVPDLPEAIVGQARLALYSRNYDKAVALSQQVLDKSPTDVRAMLLRGEMAQSIGKSDDAQAIYERVIGLYPNNLTAHVNMASLTLLAGNFAAASKHVEAVRNVPGAAVMALYLQALIEFKRQNYAGAREPIQKVISLAPENLPALLLGGATEYALGSNELAEKHLRLVVGLAPNAIAARKLLVATLLRTGQLPQAIELLQPALKRWPDDPALLILAGQVQMRANQFAAASDYFARAVALDPKDAEAKTRLGVSRLAMGDTDRALADLASAIELDPLDHKADAVVIVAHLNRKEYDQAMKAIDALERKQPANPISFNFRGGVLLARKDLAGARSAFERALSLDPTYVPAAVNLARIDLVDKKPEAARKRFTAILDKAPANVEALLALADLARATSAPAADVQRALERAAAADPNATKPHLLIAQHFLRTDPNKAIEAARKALALSPNDADVLDILGLAQLALGDVSGAQSSYYKLVALRPKSPVAHFRLASVMARNGNQAAAAQALHTALKLKPDYLESQAALASVELNAGNAAQALRLSRQLQSSIPDSPVGYLLEGDALMVEKAYLKAAGRYEKALSLARNGGIAVKLHSAYSAAGKQAIADGRLQDWLKLAPDDLGARYYLATSAQKNRQYGLAIDQYETILTKRPDDPVVLNDLASAYDQVKDARALPTAERAYKLKPDEAPIGDTLGWMLVQQGNMQRGLEILREAANKAPNGVEIRMHLVHALVKSGDKAKAAEELERIVNLRGNFPQRAEAERLFAQLQSER